MRSKVTACCAALALALTATSTAAVGVPPAGWLAQARCVHDKEGPWTANTGNGYFGGFQFSRLTWQRLGGPADPAFAHPGSAQHPFAVPPKLQIALAYKLWLADGRTWRSWGAVGAACANR